MQYQTLKIVRQDEQTHDLFCEQCGEGTETLLRILDTGETDSIDVCPCCASPEIRWHDSVENQVAS